MDIINLTGAYGRRYIGTDAMLKDWNDGKDFKIFNGPYCSIRDIELMKSTHKRIQLFSFDGKVHILPR